MTKSNKTAGALLLILFGCGLFMAGSFPERSSYFPKFICCLGLLLSALLIVLAFMQEKKAAQEEPAKTLDSRQRKRLLLMGGMILVYAFAIEIIGFTVSTILFMAAASCMLYPGQITKENKKPLLGILLSSVVISVLIFVIFKHLLYVPLPSGVLF